MFTQYGHLYPIMSTTLRFLYLTDCQYCIQYKYVVQQLRIYLHKCLERSTLDQNSQTTLVLCANY